MTAWTDHVKEFARQHNTTYGCALSMPDCSASYRAKKGEAPKRAPRIKKMKASDMMPKETRKGLQSAEQSAMLRDLKDKLLPKKRGKGKKGGDVIGDIGRVADIGLKLAPFLL